MRIRQWCASGALAASALAVVAGCGSDSGGAGSPNGSTTMGPMAGMDHSKTGSNGMTQMDHDIQGQIDDGMSRIATTTTTTEP